MLMAVAFAALLTGGALAEPVEQPSAATAPSVPPPPAPEPELQLVVPPAPEPPQATAPAAPPAPPAATSTNRRPAGAASPATGSGCDPSYPDLCVSIGAADLDCADIPRKDFAVREPDRHGFDADNDGIGCESTGNTAGTNFNPPAPNPPSSQPVAAPPPPPPPPPSSPPSGGDCDPSYPGVCIPPAPPDLDCPQISHRNFSVTGSDPHGFDGNNDGVGCES
ncbi:MAG TPA: hypothetical protein VHL54_13850 [Actinomycetota bacterium]|nr:hypothetical protein [Actinomycetota bacterium]